MHATFKDFERAYATDTRLVLVGEGEVEERELLTMQPIGTTKREYTSYFVQDRVLYGLANGRLCQASTGAVLATLDACAGPVEKAHVSPTRVYCYCEPTAACPQLQLKITANARQTSETRSAELTVATGQTSRHPQAAYLFVEDVLFLVRKSSLVRVDLATGTEESWADLSGFGITAMGRTDDYLVLGTDKGVLITVSFSTKSLGTTALHPHPVAFLLHHSHNLIISATANCLFLLTDCASMKSRTVAQTARARSAYTTRAGLLVVESPVLVEVHDISAKVLLHRLFYLSKATRQRPTPARQVAAAEYIPDIRKSVPFRPTDDHPLRMDRTTTEYLLAQGQIFHLDQLLLFYNETTDQIYAWIYLGGLELEDFCLCDEEYLLLRYTKPVPTSRENVPSTCAINLSFSRLAPTGGSFFKLVSLAPSVAVSPKATPGLAESLLIKAAPPTARGELDRAWIDRANKQLWISLVNPGAAPALASGQSAPTTINYSLEL